MPPTRKVLIADPDLDAARVLSKALRQRGFQVHYAPDGSKALELSVLRVPDLALFDEHCALVDARTFLQILHTNPRTAHIPVLLTTSSIEPDRLRAFRDGYLRKPFNLDEVLSRIDHLFRRVEAARELRGETKEIEGNLGQLALPDLLQILAMNRRTGRLTLERGSDKGEIYVVDGRPVNARTGNVEGEKALFRLMGWSEGTFAFTAGEPPSRVRIDRAMDEVVLEGARQVDETARFLAELPGRDIRLMLAADVDLGQDQHPVTAQVVELLRQPCTVGELLDRAPSTDLEVLTVLSTLLSKGWAQPVESGRPGALEPLLGPAELHALRVKALRGRVAGRSCVVKVYVLGALPAAAHALLHGLPGLVATSVDNPALQSGFGTLGRFEVSDILAVDFVLLPASEAAQPLWRPFSVASLGALLFDEAEPAVRLGRYLGFELRVPVATVGVGVPKALEASPGGVVRGPTDVREALRALLLEALSHGRVAA